MSLSYTNSAPRHTPQTVRPHDRTQPEAINPATIPQALRDLNQWANWHSDKVIRNTRTGRNGSSTNPATWASFTQAHGTDPGRLVFVFARGDGLVGLDVDDCRNPDTGELDARARDLLQRFPHIYWEVSLSGKGLHGIGYGELPEEQSGKHPEGIGVFHHSRYFVKTGNALPGHETLGAYGDGLATWYLEHFSAPTNTTPASSVSLTMDDHDIVERLRREKDGQGIAGPLLDGDNRGYPDYSTARYALTQKVCFYADDPEQIARIVRSSGLFNAADRDRDRDRKALQDARKAVAEYTGARYDPTYGSTPHLTLVPNADADADAISCADVRKELAAAQALILKLAESNHILLERIRRADEREAVYKNTNLGATRNVAAVLGNTLEEITPREPDSPTPWRLPLDRLADRTNQSPETCSRQLKGLATYTGVDGRPVATVETRTIPRRIDTTTGEVIPMKKEMWVGISCEPSKLTRILGTLAPDNAPQHGGAADRGVCPDHPNAGVIRKERTTRRITHECAHCKKALDVETVVGPSTTTHIDRIGGEPVLHHADHDDDWLPEPFAPRPHEDTAHDLHDADHDDDANLDPPPDLQHAGTTDTHTPLNCKMKVRDHEADVSTTGRDRSLASRVQQGRIDGPHEPPSDPDPGSLDTCLGCGCLTPGKYYCDSCVENRTRLGGVA